jgi:hypothetical protein
MRAFGPALWKSATDHLAFWCKRGLDRNLSMEKSVPRVTMKVILWLFIFILVAVPAFAEVVDEDDASVNGDSSIGGAGDFASAGPKVDPLIEIRNWLGRAGAPALEKKQQKPLKALYDKEVNAMDKSFQEQFGVPLRSALATQSTTSGRRRVAAKSNPELAAEVRRISNQLSDKLIATLRMDQQVPLRKYQSELVRVRRMEIMKQTMASSGMSLSAQQENEIGAIYEHESYLRTQAVIQAGGESYEMTLSVLASQTNQKVAQVLDRSQRSILSAGNSPKVPQQNP